MARRRVGVVVLLDPPVDGWVDGLRRAVGDAAIDRIAPHVTLVPPLNLRAEHLDAALERMRAAAATVPGPLELSIGPPGTFLPVNPVLYLGVGGDLPGLRRLRDAVFAPPLVRDLSWDWVPHVTLGDDLAPARITSLVSGLERFAALARIERVTLLEERHHPSGRRWGPLADAALGPPAVIGRGGMEVTLVEGRTADPVAAGLLGDPPPVVRRAADLLVVTAVVADGDPATRRCVGAAAAWLAADGVHCRVAVQEGWRGRGVGGHLLGRIETAARQQPWVASPVTLEGPHGFYAARSAWGAPGDQPGGR